VNRACLPDFLVIGAARAGTTSLYRYLKSHPQIYLSPIKEHKYFAYPETRPILVGPHRTTPIVWKLEDYRRLFQTRAGEIAAGEMSPQYLYTECSPAAIRKLIPEAKLIAILRDPAERAFSHFCHNRSGGIESLSDFRAALAAEDERIAQGWWPAFHYRNRGYYSRQLRRYFALFPREQMLILFFDDLVADCHEFLRKICAFLGVDENQPFDTSERDNATIGIPRSSVLRRFLRSAGTAKRMIRAVLPEGTRSRLFDRFSRVIWNPTPVFQPGVRAQLVSDFKPDIQALQEVIGRDLSAWLRC